MEGKAMSTTPVSHKGRIEIPSLDVILEQERAALASIADARARQKVAIEAAGKGRSRDNV